MTSSSDDLLARLRDECRQREEELLCDALFAAIRDAS